MTISKITTAGIDSNLSLSGNTSLESLTVSGIRVGKGPGSETTYVSTVLGKDALSSETTGSDNVAVGRRALKNSTTSFYNIGIGTDCLFTNTTGFQNVGVGAEALYYNETGRNNTAVGTVALCRNTIGRDNTALGFEPMAFNTTGEYNVALGSEALLNSTTGNNNTSCGTQSLYYSLTGNNNTAVGYRSGYNITSGANNTILGCFNGNQNGLDITTSNNYIVLSDGVGNPRIVVNDSGNLGIGTSSPSTKLHIKGADATRELLIVEANGGFANGAALDIKRDGVSMGKVDADYFAGMRFYVTNGAGASSTERLRIDASGSLEIKANAGNLTHYFTYNENGGEIGLYNNAAAQGTLIDLSNGVTRLLHVLSTGDMNIGIGGGNSTGRVIFKSAGFSDAMTLDANGNLLVNLTSGTAKTQIQCNGFVPSNSNVIYPSLMLTGQYGGGIVFNDGGLGCIWMQGGGTIMGFGVGTTSGVSGSLYIKSGNVGIGTNDPDSALHITSSNITNSATTKGIRAGMYAGGYAALEMVSSSGLSGWIDFHDTAGADFSERIRGGIGDLDFYTNGSHKSRINSSGVLYHYNDAYVGTSASYVRKIQKTYDMSMGTYYDGTTYRNYAVRIGRFVSTPTAKLHARIIRHGDYNYNLYVIHEISACRWSASPGAINMAAKEMLGLVGVGQWATDSNGYLYYHDTMLWEQNGYLQIYADEYFEFDFTNYAWDQVSSLPWRSITTTVQGWEVSFGT